MSVLLHLVKWQLGIADAEVWTTPAERACLVRHAVGRRRLAEVGVWHAGTACQLRAVMSSDGMLFAIDPYDKGRLGFSAPRIIGRRELARIANGRVVWVRQRGVDAAANPIVRGAAPLDFVFIDAAQSYEALCAEWEAWTPLIAPGGLLALHDTRPVPGVAEQGSERYAREVIARDRRFTTIDVVDSLTILERRDA